MLTGVTYPDNEHVSPAAKMFEEWAGYYPVKDTSGSTLAGAAGLGSTSLGDSGVGRDECSGMGTPGSGFFGSTLGGGSVSAGGTGKVPNMVEVVVGGTRLAYPSCYVLVCEGDEIPGGGSVLQPLHHQQQQQQNHPAQHLLQHQHSTPLQLQVAASVGRPLGRSVSQLSPPPSPMDSTSMLMDTGQSQLAPSGPPQQPGQQQNLSLKAIGMTSSMVAGGPFGVTNPLIGSDSMPFISSAKAEVLGYQLAEKVRQDACLNGSPSKRYVLIDMFLLLQHHIKLVIFIGAKNFSISRLLGGSPVLGETLNSRACSAFRYDSYIL